MSNLILQFNGDVSTKEAVQEYITSFIAKEGVRRMFSKEDVSHIADAKLLLDGAFEQMSIDYGIPTKPTEPTNQAR